MDRSEKQQVVDQLNRTFAESQGVLLVSFTGVNVPDATELRRKITKLGSSYQVIKNRLALRAAGDTPLDALKESFTGPTAIAYTTGDPVALAKVLKDFSKDHPGVAFKGGVLGKEQLTAEQVLALAEMPSREELISKLLFLLQAPLRNLAAALQAPLRDLGSVLKQLEKVKKETT